MYNLRSTVAACLLVAAATLPAPATELAAQESSDRGVTVGVTPQNLSADAKTWDFKIVLDTHSVDLSGDLAKSALLLDGADGKYAPIAWEGAGPGGHHREGVLKFNAISPQPKAIELQIQRPGEAKPRSFRWDLE
jgi:hypothetical protein